MVLAGLSVTIFSVHLLTLLQGRGLSLAEAVALGALIGPAQVTARLIEMASGGRHHSIWTLAGVAGLSAVGLAMLAVGLPPHGAAIFLYAAGSGIFSITNGALPLILFGANRYAPLMGRLAKPSLIAQAIPPATGAIMLILGGGDLALKALPMLAIVNVALVAWLQKKRPIG